MGRKQYQYIKQESYPVEHLVFKTEPEYLEECLAADHAVWTLGEALMEAWPGIPFLSKEVWLNKSNPGEIHYIFIWESMDAWKAADKDEFQDRLTAEFEAMCQRPYELISGLGSEKYDLTRYSRFERTDD